MKSSVPVPKANGGLLYLGYYDGNGVAKGPFASGGLEASGEWQYATWELPANTVFTLGPGPVSFAKAMEQKHGNGVSFDGAVTQSPAPRDCSSAFVPMSSVLATAPL